MRVLSYSQRQERRGVDAVLSSVGQVTPQSPHRPVCRKNRIMWTVNIVGVGFAGISIVIAVTAHGQLNTATSKNESETEMVVDANGHLHVPKAYRTTYQYLGSWTVAADQSRGSNHLHIVYASPVTIAAYGESGRFP